MPSAQVCMLCAPLTDTSNACGRVLAGVSLPGGGALLQLHDGTLVSVQSHLEDPDMRWRTITGFPEPCPDMRATPAGASSPGETPLCSL